MRESIEVQRKKLYFRAIRRGTKESDAVIGGFAERYLRDFDQAQLDRFEALLDRNDPDVLSWVTGLSPTPAEFENDVMALLKSFKSSLGTP